MAPDRMFGLDLHSHDGKVLPPTTMDGDRHEMYKWFRSDPGTDGTVHIRILCVQIDSPKKIGNSENIFEIPLENDIVEHAIWNPEVYLNLTKSAAGGAAALLDHPWRFILQTPLDGGPFCSLAMSRHGILVKGIYFYDSDEFDPRELKGGEISLSAWRSTGLQIITVPQMILQKHSLGVSQSLANVIGRVKDIESILASAEQTPPDFSDLNRTLFSCNADLVDMERRSRFEQNVLAALESVVASDGRIQIPWPPLAPGKAAVEARNFDFESLPRRIENARVTISNLIQQRNEQLNLELTQASYRIAEATLRDSKSMRTIAILTMLLLPGTAVASLFSMNMFNWKAEDGSEIATKWLWIYFVVAVPLTGLTLTAWWLWTRPKNNDLSWKHRVVRGASDPVFRDEEAFDDHSPATESVELQEVTPKGEGSD